MELTSKNLTEKIIIEKDQIRYFKPVRLTAECLYCHGDPVGSKDVTGGTKEGWREGEIHGAFEIISSLEETNNAIARHVGMLCCRLQVLSPLLPLSASI